MTANDPTAKPSMRLTRRQEMVLVLVGEGLMMREIAVKLGISEATVKAHVLTLRRKFAVGRMRDLIVCSRGYFAKQPMVPKARRR